MKFIEYGTHLSATPSFGWPLYCMCIKPLPLLNFHLSNTKHQSHAPTFHFSLLCYLHEVIIFVPHAHVEGDGRHLQETQFCLSFNLQNVTANHRVNDVIATEDGHQTLVGRFMYGPLDMVTLTGEKVRDSYTLCIKTC